jgi:DNA-binding response OmpR family regulator
MRSDQPDLAIIMLMARAEEMDVIVGLVAGADDYVPKPVPLAESVARIRARLRVAQSVTTAEQTGPLSGASIDLDPASRRCFVAADADTIEIELTSKEFDLLQFLMRCAGTTLKRDDTMSEVWDENWWGSTRTLDTHISTLRKKILDRTDPPSKIVTVRGLGFRFQPEAAASILLATGG